MRLIRYLNQTAIWEKRISAGEGWATVQYADPVEIRARVTTMVRKSNESGKITYFDLTKFLTEAVITPGDRINGEEINAVEKIIGRRGNTIGVKAFHKPPTSFSDF